MPETAPSDNPGVRIPPPLIFVAVFLAGQLLQKLFEMHLPIREALADTAGIVVALCGAMIALKPFIDFARIGTGIVPIRPATTLVVSGLYRFTRNPMYVGLSLIYAGVSLTFEAPGSLLLLPVAIVIIDRYVIPREEAYLERRFGPEYVAYKQQVRRWV